MILYLLRKANFIEKEKGLSSLKSSLMEVATARKTYPDETLLELSENSCILFDEAEDVMNRGFSDFGKASKGYLNQVIEKTPVPIIWTTNNILDVDPAVLRRMTYTIEFEKLSENARLNIWEKAVRKNKLKVDKQKLIELNKNYDIPPSLITSAIESTKLIDGTQDDIEAFAESVARVVMKKKSVKKQKGFEMSEYNENLVNTDLDIKNLTSKIKKEQLRLLLFLWKKIVFSQKID